MNTTELNGTEYTLTEGEGGKITLTPIKITLTPLKKQPIKWTPEAGDVWEDNRFGEAFLIGDKESICLDSECGPSGPGGCSVAPFDWKHDTYKGKFNEVYVKISDVREALSHKDVDGQNMLDCLIQRYKSKVQVYGSGESFKALRKLNIITD